MLTPSDIDRLITGWLARAHTAPAQARTEWSHHGVALLPLGGLFASVRLPGHLVHAAVGSEDPGHLATVLSKWLHGPVIHDHRTAGPTYYALIQWHAGLVWDCGDIAPCLQDGTYLGVPRFDRRQPPGTYWVVAPRYEGDLCRPQAVRELVAAGRWRLSSSLSPS